MTNPLVAVLILVVSAFNVGCSQKEALDVAICTQNANRVKDLLAKGVDPDFIFEEGPAKGFTPLTWALVRAPELCERAGPNTDVAIALIEHGADVNKRAITFGGRTPLMEAASTYELEVIDLLLEKGADPNLTDDKGYTAAMVVGGLPKSKEVLAALIEGDLDLTLVASDGRTALDWVKQQGQQEQIKLIMDALNN